MRIGVNITEDGTGGEIQLDIEHDDRTECLNRAAELLILLRDNTYSPKGRSKEVKP